MNLLALETATEHCSVALLRVTAGGREQLARGLHAPRQQTELILPMVDDVLAEAGISLRDLDALAYSCGPGAFTGVRIAAAVAQGLALGADLPVLPVSSLQAQAQGAARVHGAGAVLACFDARMQEVYAGAYHRDDDGLMQPLLAEVACRPDALPDTLVGAWSAVAASSALAVGSGSGWSSYGELLAGRLPVTLQDGDLPPDAGDVAALALPRLRAGRAVAPELALPVYLRDDVWKKLPGR
ncbi:MAG: tRNA (adenosine(37)-N6)-threonylcarbamoyltransferase complex dimerization subunit type 1 TsaB [Perlucidibaca sp.]